MRKPVMLALVLCTSALVTSSAFGLVASRERAAHAGTPAVEHVKPAPVAEATPPAIKTIAKRSDVGAAKPEAPAPPKATKPPAPETIGIDMTSPRCTKRPLGSGKPGEMVTVCE